MSEKVRQKLNAEKFHRNYHCLYPMFLATFVNKPVCHLQVLILDSHQNVKGQVHHRSLCSKAFTLTQLNQLTSFFFSQEKKMEYTLAASFFTGISKGFMFNL